MAQVVELPEPEPWFLVHRGGAEPDDVPDVVMEFDTKAEAEDALCTASVDALIEPAAADGLPMTICSAREMFDDPALRSALEVWKAHLVELEADTVRMMEEQFLGSTPPLLRPGRRRPGSEAP